MQLGLGIDTGGTYTDSVLYDFSSKEIIAKAKSLTTKEELSLGIIKSLRNLPKDNLRDIKLISLSTTLATNACVEDKGSRGHLILLGFDENLYNKLAHSYGLPKLEEVTMINGSHGQEGQAIEEPDWDLLNSKVKHINNSIDAYGVVEYWGIRNPEYEQKAKELIREWTGKPVVCAHELSNEINTLRRASTTLLNAKLIPLIDGLISAVKIGIEEMGIDAPIMIVRGDGTLMSESYAKEHPVETLLSGPAASVVGGINLSGNKDALILDIGGTTSDLAVVRDGLAVLASEGVNIAGWRTGTRAIKIHTIGLGGDSSISFDKNDNITIGPRKATPLSWMAVKYPYIKNNLKEIYENRKWHTFSLAEFLYLVNKPSDDYDLSNEDKEILKALEDGPLSVEDLAQAIDTRPYFLNTETLESHGIIARCTLTPTDIMHIKGEFTDWDSDAAELGLNILADRLNMEPDDAADEIYTKFKYKLYMMICSYLLERDNIKQNGVFSKDTIALLEKSFYNHDNIELKFNINSKLPLIGIGAPTHVFLDDVAKALGTHSVLSEHAGVANAIGAITGSIIGEETVIIKPRYDAAGVSNYGCHSSLSYKEFDNYEEAVEWAKDIAKDIAMKSVKNMGANSNVELEVLVNEQKVTAKDIKEGLLLESTVCARALGSKLIF